MEGGGISTPLHAVRIVVLALRHYMIRLTTAFGQTCASFHSVSDVEGNMKIQRTDVFMPKAFVAPPVVPAWRFTRQMVIE